MLRLILRRLIAMVIDVALLFLVLWPAGLGVLLASGLRPQTGPQVYAVLLVNFSLPVWAYFMLSDASGSGRTVGKWLMGIRVSAIGWSSALVRTAVKLAAWELIHLGFFGLAQQPGEPGLAGWISAGAAYALLLCSLGIVVWTGGSRSLHDLAAGSTVEGVTPVA